MPSLITGLLNSESDASWRFNNVRRSINYNYPNGSAVLVALSALLKEEAVNDQKFVIFEKRFAEASTTTKAITTGFISTTGTNTEVANQIDYAVDALARICVTSTTRFRAGNIIRIRNLACGAAGATLANVNASVESVVDATHLEIRWLETVTDYYVNATNVGIEVLVIGNAAYEGQTGAALVPYQLPDELYNYLQISRTPFQLTGSANKTALRQDKNGPYPDKAKDAMLAHATEQEKTWLFGTRGMYTDTTTGLPKKMTGGIEWYLKQWELGTVYGNSATAITADTDDQKRIINNTAGTLTLKQWNGYLERLFRVTSNEANEKVVLCGNGFLMTLNDLYAGKAVFNYNSPIKAGRFGYDFVSQVTPWGTVHYKTHPLFNLNAYWRYGAFALDTGNLKYMYLKGRDTQLLTEREPNNADYLEDEWLGECGLQLTLPESCMIFKNMQTAI